MGMFSTRKPRKYRRVSIYSDERKEKLDKLVNDVKREMGELPPKSSTEIPSYKGRFADFTPRASADGMRRKVKWPVLVFIIVLLFLLWRFIAVGAFRF